MKKIGILHYFLIIDQSSYKINSTCCRCIIIICHIISVLMFYIIFFEIKIIHLIILIVFFLEKIRYNEYLEVSKFKHTTLGLKINLKWLKQRSTSTEDNGAYFTHDIQG